VGGGSFGFACTEIMVSHFLEMLFVQCMDNVAVLFAKMYVSQKGDLRLIGGGNKLILSLL